MTCGLCGRTLKGTASIEKGYGPVCYRKIMPPAPKKSKKVSEQHYAIDDIPDYKLPGQMELSDFIDMPEEK